MALISSNGYAHVRLTVTDIERSKKFYDELFGWPKAIDSSASVDEDLKCLRKSTKAAAVA